MQGMDQENCMIKISFSNKFCPLFCAFILYNIKDNIVTCILYNLFLPFLEETQEVCSC